MATLPLMYTNMSANSVFCPIDHHLIELSEGILQYIDIQYLVPFIVVVSTAKRVVSVQVILTAKLAIIASDGMPSVFLE